MPVGNINSSEKGSGARYNDGKPDYSIMPMHLMDEVCRVWTYGEAKYARWNWLKGMAWSIPYACACRHLFAFWRGERNDPETGFSHLAHVVCNVMMLLHYDKAFKEGDDRPKAHFQDKADLWAKASVPVEPDPVASFIEDHEMRDPGERFQELQDMAELMFEHMNRAKGV